MSITGVFAISESADPHFFFWFLVTVGESS